MKLFWEKVDKSAPGGCWLWTAFKNPGGYGQMTHKGRRWLAHRFSWVMEHGGIPEGMFVCHHCDNPACVNPDHLFVGTCADNVADMHNKNRARKALNLRNGKSKLSPSQVREIRRLHSAGTLLQKDIARRFSICPSYVSRLVNERRRTRLAPSHTQAKMRDMGLIGELK